MYRTLSTSKNHRIAVGDRAPRVRADGANRLRTRRGHAAVQEA